MARVVSDALIAGAYFSIAFTLYRFARKHPDVNPRRTIFLLAGLVLAAGTTHVLAALGIWHWEGLAEPITAVVSVAAAIAATRLCQIFGGQPESPLPADELQRVHEELRRSYVEIEQFAHVASHDLQEPLRMVTNYLQLIERRYASRLDDDAREFIGFAVAGAKRMKALIRDLLEFSQAGANAASFRAVRGELILQDALGNLKTAIDESSAQITADPLPTIIGDQVLLTQVLQNLIANAIKFQKNDTPRIHVSARRQSDHWIFSVQDNGIGIERRHFDRIFRIFERLHSAEEYSGSGIGLAISKKVVERHGGTIWAESHPGKGSTFFFSLSAKTAIVDDRTTLSFSATP